MNVESRTCRWIGPVLVLILAVLSTPASAQLDEKKVPTLAAAHSIDRGRTAAVAAHDFIEMQGGLPVVVDGAVIGGIGAGFDTDVEIARASLAALTVQLGWAA